MSLFVLTVSLSALGLSVVQNAVALIVKNRFLVSEAYPPTNDLYKIKALTNVSGIATFSLEPDDYSTFHTLTIYDTAGIQIHERVFSMPVSNVNIEDTTTDTSAMVTAAASAVIATQQAELAIAAAAASTAIKNFATYTEQMAYAGTYVDGQKADIFGYLSAGDGGFITMFWSAASTATHNGGDVRKPTEIIGAGRWLSLYKTMNLEQWGIIGNGSTDCTNQFNLAAAAAIAGNLHLTGTVGKTYFFNSADVNIRKVSCDFTNSNILVGGGFKLICGGNAGTGDNVTQKLGRVTRSGGATATPTIRCIGAKDQSIFVRFTDYFQLYADSTTAVYATDYSNGYSSFYLDFCIKLELTNNPTGTKPLDQWNNENSFWLKRTTTVIIDGTYPHNNNHFYTGGLEVGTITINKGTANTFHNLRYEGGGTITFASGTYSNKVFTSNPTTAKNDYDNAVPANIVITDNGVGNVVMPYSHIAQERIPIVNVNTRNCLTFSNVVGSTNFARAPNFTSIRGVDVQAYGINRFTRASNKMAFDSPYIPVSVGIGLNFKASHALFRPRIEIFDINKNRITNENASPASNYIYLQTDSGFIWTTDRYIFSSNVATCSAVVKHQDVAFVKFDVMMGSASTDVGFDDFAVMLVTNKKDPRIFNGSAMQFRTPASASTPIIGFAAELGQQVSKTAAAGSWNCVFSLDTSLAADGVASTLTLNVTTVTGITSGDIIGIQLDDGKAHWTTVNGTPVGNVVTLAVALQSAAAINSRVVVNRWL
jgi:hypothetical protein